MTQFHANVWNKSPHMDTGIGMKLLTRYPEAQNSPILRAIVEKEVRSFSYIQGAILDQMCVETAFPLLRIR